MDTVETEIDPDPKHWQNNVWCPKFAKTIILRGMITLWTQTQRNERGGGGLIS